MELFVIRHAQSANNALWAANQSDVGRFADPELSDLGEQQARYLARYLATANDGSPQPNPGNRYGLTHLYSSLMVRAIVTGTHVAEALDLPLGTWELVHEWGGIFDKDPKTGERVGLPGPNRAYFEARFPHLALPDSLGEAGWWNRPYEAPEEAPARAAQFLEEVIAKHGHTDDRVAIFTHAGFSHALLRTLTQYQRKKELPTGEVVVGFWKNNTGITRLRFTDDSIRVIGVNNISFLPDALIS